MQQLNGNPRERETEFTKDVRPSDSGCLRKVRIHLRVKIMMMNYKDIHDYTDHKAGFIRKRTISREKVGGALRPLRDCAHIRCSKRSDYQLNICNV